MCPETPLTGENFVRGQLCPETTLSPDNFVETPLSGTLMSEAHYSCSHMTISTKKINFVNVGAS